MSASRPLPNPFALYLLPWILISRPVAQFWGIPRDHRHDGLASDKGVSACAAPGEGAPDEEALNPNEEVRLLHILE